MQRDLFYADNLDETNDIYSLKTAITIKLAEQEEENDKLNEQI